MSGNAPHKTHMKKADIKEFVMFCLRDDIADQLAKVYRPHQLAVELYEKETGKKVSTTTAYNQQGRWAMIDGKLCEVRRQKDFVPIQRPRAPYRSKVLVPPATPPPKLITPSSPETQIDENAKIEG